MFWITRRLAKVKCVAQDTFVGNDKKALPVLLLFYDEEEEEVRRKHAFMAQQMGLPKQKIRFLIVDLQKRHQEHPCFVGFDDFNLWGKVKESSVLNDVVSDVGILVCAAPINHLLLQYLILTCTPHFRVGFASDDFPFFDLSIGVDGDDWEQFCSEVTRYLKILKKI